MSEAPQGGEIARDSFLEVDPPQRLEEGQNFYNQMPFRDILSSVAQNHSLTVEQLRRILSTLTSLSAFAEYKTTEALTSAMRAGFARAKIDHLLIRHADAQERRTYWQAIRELGTQLAEFPFWRDYIKSNRTSNYFHDGSQRPKQSSARFPTTAPNYAQWVTEKIARTYRLRLEGLQEALPRGFGTEPTTRVPAEVNPSPVGKTYRILKMSELVRFKKKSF